MSDVLGDPLETRAWELRPRHLVICPGLSFEEWSDIWASVHGTHESSAFWVGDALVYGEAAFGEDGSAALTADGVGRNERMKQCKWVCSRIEPARRRLSLSFTMHRLVAKFDTAEQDRFLDRAEAEGWHSRELDAAVKEFEAQRKAEKDAARQARRNTRAPEEQVEPEDGEKVTRVTEGDSPSDAATEAEALRGRNIPPESEEPSPDPPFVASEPLEDPAEELRSIIEGIRWVQNDLVLGKADLQSVQDLERRALLALGRPMYGASPLRTDMPAESLIPPEWSVKIEGGEFVFGARKWTVELRKGNQRAIGAGPSLACAVTEAALAAALSQLGRRDTS